MCARPDRATRPLTRAAHVALPSPRSFPVRHCGEQLAGSHLAGADGSIPVRHRGGQLGAALSLCCQAAGRGGAGLSVLGGGA